MTHFFNLDTIKLCTFVHKDNNSGPIDFRIIVQYTILVAIL